MGLGGQKKLCVKYMPDVRAATPTHCLFFNFSVAEYSGEKLRKYQERDGLPPPYWPQHFFSKSSVK